MIHYLTNHSHSMTNSLINLLLPPFSLTFATVPFTFVTLIRTLYFNYAYYLYYSFVRLVSHMYHYIYCAVRIRDPHFVLAP